MNRRTSLSLFAATPLLGWAPHRGWREQIREYEPEPSRRPRAGRFKVSNGQILDPFGNVFKARGVNIPFMSFGGPAVETGHVVRNAACQPLTSTFPGVNFVRFLTFWDLDQLRYCSLAAMQPYIDRLSARGIVVMIEPPYYPTILSGIDLKIVCNWYASIASHYRDNPYIWFETQNEPSKDRSGNWASPDPEIIAIYDAIRNTAGNPHPIAICPFSGGKLTNMNPSKYLPGFTNVIWDIHFYGWLSDFNTDQATVDAKFSTQIAAFTGIRSADGVIPIIIAEFGTATGGVGDTKTGFYGSDGQWYDHNWSQVLRTVYRLGQSHSGWAQFLWNTADMSPAPHTNWNNGTLDPPFDGSVLSAGGQALKAALAAADGTVIP